MPSGARFLPAFAALCGCFVAFSASAEDPRCDELTPLRGSESGYRSRGNRCEGLYVAAAGSRSLVVKSFTLGRLRFDLASATPLEITAPDQKWWPVNVRAVAIPLTTYYRMDATLAPGATLHWPLKDVLAPEGLTDSRIGVFGWRGGGGSLENGQLFPLRVTAHGIGPTSQTPLLIIQASFDAQKVKWRWSANDARCAEFGSWKDAIPGPVAAGWPIAIDLAKLPAGVHCLEAVAQSASTTDWLPLRVRVNIPRVTARPAASN
jgi:hypothetical protein